MIVPAGATSLRISFAVSRTESQGALIQFASGPRLTSLVASALGLEATFKPAAGEEAMTVETRITGEPLALSRILWGAGSPIVWTPAGHSKPLAADPVARQLAANIQSLDSFRAAAEEADQLRGQLNIAEPREVAAARDFFTDYDRATSPELIDLDSTLSQARKDELKGWVYGLAEILKSRIIAKAHKTAGPLPVYDAAIIEAISKLQLGIYLAHYPDPADPTRIDIRALSLAFLLFANGSLHDAEFSMSGQPNSAHCFSFAEFAELAIDSNVSDHAVWSALLPTLVDVQEVYVNVYAPHHPPPWAWYEFLPANLNLKNQLTLPQLQARLGRYYGIVAPVPPRAKAVANAEGTFQGLLADDS